jgi:hypothetical protein
MSLGIDDRPPHGILLVGLNGMEMVTLCGEKVQPRLGNIENHQVSIGRGPEIERRHHLQLILFLFLGKEVIHGPNLIAHAFHPECKPLPIRMKPQISKGEFVPFIKPLWSTSIYGEIPQLNNLIFRFIGRRPKKNYRDFLF